MVYGLGRLGEARSAPGRADARRDALELGLGGAHQHADLPARQYIGVRT